MKQRYFAGADCTVSVTDRVSGETQTIPVPAGSLFTLDQFGHPGRCDIEADNAAIVYRSAPVRAFDNQHPLAGDTAATQNYLPSPAVQQQRMIEAITSKVLDRAKSIIGRKADAARTSPPVQPALTDAQLAAADLEADAVTTREPGEVKRKLGDDVDEAKAAVPDGGADVA